LADASTDPVVVGLGRVLILLIVLAVLGVAIMVWRQVSDQRVPEAVAPGGFEQPRSADADGPEGGTVIMAAAQPAHIHFDLSTLNEDGLLGPPGGLRALSYEFCIPAEERTISEVKSIDQTVEIYRDSPGRIGCTEDQSLVIGNTHQPGFRKVLQQLSELPYVTRVDQAFFE